MNANHCCAKQNRFLPIEPDTAVLLRPVSLATHTHTNLVAFGSDNWRTHSDITQKTLGNLETGSESMGRRREERRGLEGGVFEAQANFPVVHYANQADRFD